MAIAYTKELLLRTRQLYSKRSNFSVTKDVCDAMKRCGIWKPFRGCRAGKLQGTRQPIQYDTTERCSIIPVHFQKDPRYISRNEQRRCNPFNLINIQKTKTPKSQSLLPSILLSNTRSIVSKIEDLQMVIRTNNVDITCITETWLTDIVNDSVIDIEGYAVIRRDRTSRIGGGVCAFVKNTIPFKILNEFHNDNFETLWLYLRPYTLPRGFSCIICCVCYHPPSNDDKQLIQNLADTLDQILIIYPNAGVIFAGDFNRCDISPLRRQFNLKQLVNQPTRGNAILDLILTNLTSYYNSPNILPPIGLSDHMSVLLTPQMSVIRNTSKTINIRKKNLSTKTALGKWLCEYNWNLLYSVYSCEDKLSLFQSILKIGIETFLPARRVKLHVHDQPWITSNFKAIIAERQKAFQDKNWPNYNRLRNKTNKLCKKLKANFFNKKIKQLASSSDPGKWWKSVKQLAGCTNQKLFSCLVVNNQIMEGKELADKINNSFGSVTQSMSPLVPVPLSTTTLQYYPIPSEYYVSEEETYEKLSSIKSSKSPGPDQIPNWVLKEFALELAAPVASIFNASFQQSCVPQAWKEADIIPVPKVPVVQDINKHLRPISLTSTLSKTCERFIVNWLMKAIKTRIDPRQFGSLPKLSTSHALLSLTHHLLKETDESKNTVRIFLLDFAKAFDHIDHHILLNKLEKLNIEPTIFNWIKSFLTNRKQRTRLGQVTSDWGKLNGGVPQGTVLGPVLFIIMINDLLSYWADRWKYVDDSTVAESIPKHGNSTLQSIVDEIHTWTKTNGMKLNISKCKEMVINFARNKTEFPPLLIENKAVEKIISTRVLGLILQNDLKWNEHIHYMTAKANRRLYMLRLLKRAHADPDTLVNVYSTIIRPVLEYACVVWNYNIPAYLDNEIEMVQKRAMRIICPFAHYKDALTDLAIQTLAERRTAICKSFFNLIILDKNNLQDYLPARRNNNLRNNNNFTTFKCKTNRFLKSFFPQSVLNFNTEYKTH